MSVKTQTNGSRSSKSQKGRATSPFEKLLPKWMKRAVTAFLPDQLRDSIQEEAAKLPPMEEYDPDKAAGSVDSLPKELVDILESGSDLPRETILSGKEPVPWKHAVGCISNACYLLADNRMQAMRDWAKHKAISLLCAAQYVDHLLATGGALLEDAADFKDLKGPARREIQEFLKKTGWFYGNLTKVNMTSPGSSVSSARDRAAQVIRDAVTAATDKTVHLFNKKHMEINTSLATSHLIAMALNNARNYLEIDTPENPMGWTDIKKEIVRVYKGKGIPGAETYWSLAKLIKEYKAHRATLLSRELFEDAALYRECVTSQVRKLVEGWDKKTQREFVCYSTLGVLVPWFETKELLAKYGIYNKKKGVKEMIFGIDVLRRNTTVLNAALDVRKYSDVKGLSSDDLVDDDNVDMIIKHNGAKAGISDLLEDRKKICEISISGSFRPEGKDFVIDAAGNLMASFDLVGEFFIKAIANRKITKEDSSEVKWAKLPETRIGGEQPLREWYVEIFQDVFEGELPEEEEKNEVIRPSTTLSGDNVTMKEIPHMEPEGRIGEIHEGNQVNVTWYDEEASIKWKTPNHKSEKRKKAFMMTATHIFRVGANDKKVKADLPETATFEAYTCQHPRTVWKNTFEGEPTEQDLLDLVGVYVGCRGWFDDPNGEVKSVHRIDFKCPEDTFLYTHDSFKSGELEVIKASSNILCMYKHKGDHPRTNRSMMHRTDLMLACIKEFDKYLSNNKRINGEIMKSIERTMGTVPCPMAFSKIAAMTIGNSDNVKNYRLPMKKFAYKLYLRPCLKELGEKVQDGHMIIDTHMWEGVVSVSTFEKIAAVTGGPDLDDAFYVIIYEDGSVEVLRDPQVAGDGLVLGSCEVL
jgi:hypothetical protein